MNHELVVSMVWIFAGVKKLWLKVVSRSTSANTSLVRSVLMTSVCIRIMLSHWCSLAFVRSPICQWRDSCTWFRAFRCRFFLCELDKVRCALLKIWGMFWVEIVTRNFAVKLYFLGCHQFALLLIKRRRLPSMPRFLDITLVTLHNT